MNIQLKQCDLCKKKFEGEAEIKAAGLVTIRIGFDTDYYYGSISGRSCVRPGHPDWNKEVCVECMARLGFTRQSVEEARKAEAPAPVTLEDLIRDIVRSELPQ